MWASIIYRHELAKLQRAKRRLEKSCDAEMEAARIAKKPRSEIEKLNSDWSFEFEMNGAEVKRLQSRFLMEQANSLLLETAKYNNLWDKGRYIGPYLQAEALEELNKSVRKEKKDQREAWLVFAPALSGLTGIIGAIIGLVALFKK